MDYETRLKAAHKELSEKGVWKSNYNPPIAKLLRKVGIYLPPSYYLNFFSNFMLCMVTVAPVWGILNWFLVWGDAGKPILEAVYMALLVGALFGLIMATFYLIRRKQLKLSDWNLLVNTPET